MNAKTQTTINWWILGALVLVIAAFFAFPSGGGDYVNARECADISELRQLALILFRYADENGKYPESLSDLLDTKYITDIKHMREVVSVITYIKPPGKSSDTKQVMLILPSIGGTVISYSDAKTEFIRNRKSK